MNLFVYGTLKHGERNHDRFCRDATTVKRAAVRGRLYDLPFGFPALVVPGEDVRAVGTMDYLADAELTRGVPARAREDFPGWDTVHGELLTFSDGEDRLPKIDGLEGYVPGEGEFYVRVLVPVALVGGTVLAWTYCVEEGFGVRLRSGSWSG